jgi:hypothetical protein
VALFQKHAAWLRAMAHVGVVGLYAGWILAAGDQELQHPLKRRLDLGLDQGAGGRRGFCRGSVSRGEVVTLGVELVAATPIAGRAHSEKGKTWARPF